jgi:GntR family transcriptional regulator, transcriptional repressor for pyruvate dehydrogenase complex
MRKNTNMRLEGNQNLGHAILHALQLNGQPMGSWSLHFHLREHGYNVSAPTIGRKLRDLERDELVRKDTVDGRLITPKGVRLLGSATKDHRVRASAEEALKLLKSNRQKDILDLLAVRRIIEEESAYLAAMNASAKDIARLERSIHRQRIKIAAGDLGVEQDVDFHENLARASGNKFIAYCVHLLRSQDWMNYAVIAIRAKVGSGIVVDHEKVISAVRDHHPAAARTAMRRHIMKMTAEVKDYMRRPIHPIIRSRRSAIEALVGPSAPRLVRERYGLSDRRSRAGNRRLKPIA